jgi:GNAT superfamily N-acetyltransferase
MFGETPALELQRIYLLAQYWNKGHGKTLLDFAKTWAKEQNFEWIWLIVWFKNDGAIRFYQREGWEIFGRKDFLFGNEIHHDFAFRIKT